MFQLVLAQWRRKVHSKRVEIQVQMINTEITAFLAITMSGHYLRTSADHLSGQNKEVPACS